MTAAGRKALDELRQSEGLDASLPWGGRSPRCLTRAYERFSLEPLGDDANEFFNEGVLDEQYERFRDEGGR